MTDVSNAAELLRQGQAAARVGLRDKARGYLREAVQVEPDNIEAWLELAGVEDEPGAKRACFETVLQLDPANVDAQLGMDLLQPGATSSAAAEVAHDHELDMVMAEASRELDRAVGPPPSSETPLDDEVVYCANHPGTETVLRCNRCGKPICTRCAVQTPVGYRCKQCVGEQQSVYFTGGAADYVIGGVIALVLGGIASYIVTIIGAWFIALILGPTIGIGIAEVVRLAVRRRRSQYLWMTVAIGIVLGSLPALLVSLGSLWRMIAYGLFLVLAIGAATARLR
jgi:hypothetical protein